MKLRDQTGHEDDVYLFDTVFEQDAMGMALRAIDPRDSRWLRVNQKFCDMLGYTREELLQLTSIDISLPDERDLSTEYNEKLLRGELSSYSREKRYLRKDGTVIWTNIWLSVVFGPDGKPTKIISVIHDITQHKLAEEALREAHDNLGKIVAERTSELRAAKETAEAAEELLSKVYQSSPALFSISSPKSGRHFNVNEAWTSITGYSREEALQKTALEINLWVNPADRVKFIEAIHNRGLIRNYEAVYRTKYGVEKNMLLSGELIDFQNDEGMLVVGQDITEQKQAEKALKDAHDELEVRIEERTAELKQKNIELEQFAYTVSHDLKSPLVTINSFIGLLKKDLQAGDSESIAKDMQHIVSAVSQMGRSLDDLLELSRVGRVVNQPQPISLGQISDDVICILGGLLTDSKFEIEIASDMPAVFADKHRIREVMQNLLENAIKFGGEHNKPRISVSADIQGNWVRCCVEDNGIGIDPRYHDKVFGLFDRLDQGIDGTGIGLAMVKRIIEGHNGKVWIESAGIGQGTQVYFTLPAA